MVDEVFESEREGTTREVPVRSLREARLRMNDLTASGYAAGKRVCVTVDSEGALIETRLSPDVDELTYDEIAAAIVSAAGAAVVAVRRKTKAILAPLAPEFVGLPRVSDIVAAMPDRWGMPPDWEPARDSGERGVRSTDAESRAHDPRPGFDAGATEPSW